MDRLRAWFHKLRVLFTGDRFDRDMQEEMQLHLDLRRRQYAGDGASSDDALRNARLRFGNPTSLREASRDAWGCAWLDHFRQDAHYALRSMRRTPGFALAAVLALALGIGANVAIFTVVNAVLLRPLPYKDSDRLVVVLHDGSNPVAVANYIDWKAQQTVFESMAAADYWTPNLLGVDPPEHIWALKVTADMFPMLGVEPLLGRAFVAGEDAEGHEYEVVLSYRLWQRRFGGDRNVLGQTVTLDGKKYNIVGVMPPDFRFAPFWATKAELWAPNVLGPRLHNRGGNSLRVFARLKDGVTLEQARAQMSTITGRLEQQYPGTNRDVQVMSLKERVVGEVRPALMILLGAVAFVLLIACANVAHMLLARTAARQREIAVRVALGASRSRVIRQFLTESLFLALTGAAAGLGIALAGIRALVALSPEELPRVDTVAIDSRVLLFLTGITALTVVLFGIAPAMHGYVLDLVNTLKDGGRGATLSKNRLRSFLIASEFALALALLVGAGLMVRSFVALQSIDPGFRPQGVLSMVVSVAGTAEAEPVRRAVFYRELLDKVRTIPGVAAAGAINHLPLAGDLWGWSFAIEGRPPAKPGDAPNAVYRIVTPGYFQSMQIPILRGRDISPADSAGSPGVVIINEQAAKRFWPGEDPVGKRISFVTSLSENGVNGPPNWLTVIGIARNAKQGDWATQPYPETYIAAFQSRDFLTNAHMDYITLVVRSSGADAGELTKDVKSAVWSFDRNLPISQVATMNEVVAEATATPRFESVLLGSFAAVALLLAAIGIYGVMSYVVSRRTNEIGIRMSLGASRSSVLALVLKDGMILALVGAACGLVISFTLGRFMSKVLYAVKPNDPLTYLIVVPALLAVALAATLLPARRATRIDPMIALRHD